MKPLQTTEQRNDASYKIDTKSTIEMLQIINNEDKKVPYAVETAIEQIANIVDAVAFAFNNGGRLFYIGAGTSGRLGVLDASECPPTFGVSKNLVQGIISGGVDALTNSIENAEDDGDAGVKALKDIDFTQKDVLIGISASGGAPFVVDALKYARNIGAIVGAISCNKDNKLFEVVDKDYCIYLPVGPEILTGSTRLKSGTSQKLVLNMITTGAMIKTGKVYNNLMVNVMPVNSKLIKRSHRLICEITGCSEEEAINLFSLSNNEVKTAIIMRMLAVDANTARKYLDNNNGSINKVLDSER